LAAKQKELKKQGKGNKVNASQPFTEEDMNLFWEKNLLGTSTYLYFIFAFARSLCSIDSKYSYLLLM
jgi:hypothetical protein